MKKILDGKKLAEKLNLELKEKISEIYNKIGKRPKLATILVGDNPASKVYVNIKHRTCKEVGIESLSIELNENITKQKLIEEIEKLNKNPDIHGILLQLPLPKNLAPYTSEILEKIDYNKDVDGFHPINRGKLFDYNEELAPCTPKGIIALLEHYNIDLKGKEVIVINRSNLVGKPLIFMLLKRNATVTVCHTSTVNIEKHIGRADILIVAVGVPKWKKISKNTIKKGVIIIDVGINKINGKLCGDVDFDEVYEKCSYITPVPGGIGPLTVSFLLQNTFTVFNKNL
ncbi:MAG: bifunctional 5,10-methylenetetrahydrofolate dehydrogenase/5,10-methenyltetrahydrofolate cyclohydrolase [Promethearchaeota archaeon]